MLRLFLVSLLCSPLVLAVADSPKFTLQPRDTTAVQGERVTLYCSVSGQNGGQYVWVKDGAVVARGFDVVAPEPHRFSIGTSDQDAHNLIVDDSRAEDSGDYRCVVTIGGSGLISDTARLEVLSAPTAEYPVCTGAGSGEVAVGERLYLSCDVEGGNPKAQLFMNKGDVAVETVTTETGVRYDWMVSESDEAAEFTCIGTHRFWAEPRTCHLGPFHIVSGPPILSLAPAAATVQAGRSMSFLCSAQAAPRASYKWFMGGEEVVDEAGDAARMTVQAIGGSSVLLVHDVGQGEASIQITCVVDSATGTAGANAILHVEPVYTTATEGPLTPENVPDNAGPDNAGPDSAGPDSAGPDNTPVDTGDDNDQPEIFESTSLPFIVGGAVGGLIILLAAVAIVACAVQRGRSSTSATRSTEKLAEGAPLESDVFYRSRFVGIARSWLFPVHKDTQKGMTASMASKPVQS